MNNKLLWYRCDE